MAGVEKAKIRKIMLFIVIIGSCLFVGMIGIWRYHHDNKRMLRNPVRGGVEDTSWSGDRVFFGSYEQDNHEENGPEPILWRVLAVDGKKALLLSEYALDCVPYNDTFEEVTWETCTVRKWLNEEFYERAFGSRADCLKTSGLT